MQIVFVVLIILIVLTVFYCITNKVRIKFRTFLKPGFRPARGIFGVYCYTGKQGKGKTYSMSLEKYNSFKMTVVPNINVKMAII